MLFTHTCMYVWKYRNCEKFLRVFPSSILVDRLRHKSAELIFGWVAVFFFCHLAVSPFPDSTFRWEQSQIQFHFSLFKYCWKSSSPIEFFLKVCAHSATINRRSSHDSSHSSKPVSSHAQRCGYRWVRHEKSMFGTGRQDLCKFFLLKMCQEAAFFKFSF